MKKILSMVLALLLLCTACGGFRDKESAVLYGYGADGAAAQRIGACYGVTAADAPAAEGMADMPEAAQQQAVIDAVAEDKYGISYIYSMTAEDSDAVKEIEITDAPALQIMIARRDDYAPDTLEVDFYHFLINVVGQEIAEEMGYTGLVEMPLAMCGACVKPAGKLHGCIRNGQPIQHDHQHQPRQDALPQRPLADQQYYDGCKYNTQIYQFHQFSLRSMIIPLFYILSLFSQVFFLPLTISVPRYNDS